MGSFWDLVLVRVITDHSRLLHGTTNVYCEAVNTFGSSTGEFACVKEDLETVFFLQDIPVRKSKSMARVMWDKGSKSNVGQGKQPSPYK